MIKPASRFNAIPPYLFAEISRVKAEAIASGANIIDLGIGDPDLPTPPEIIDALSKAARNPATHRYDESPRGWRPFLQAAARWYQRNFGVTLDAETEFCQLIGSKEGLAHLAWTYAESGDTVIVPNPGYPVYRVNALMAGAEVYETPLREENEFLPVFEDIPVEVAKRATLFYVCYPHNPTGAVAPIEFYEQAVEFCRDHEILLVNDMAYATVTYDGFVNATALQVKGAKDWTIEFHSLSKMYNMTGWRLGFACGNSEAVEALQKLKSNLDSKQFPAIADAGAYALDHVDNAESQRIYQSRRDALCKGLARIGWEVSAPKASFYIWAKVPHPTMTSAEFAKELLQKAHVVVVPGTGYGTEGEGYVRMSLTMNSAGDGDLIAEVIRRIEASGLVKAPAIA